MSGDPNKDGGNEDAPNMPDRSKDHIPPSHPTPPSRKPDSEDGKSPDGERG